MNNYIILSLIPSVKAFLFITFSASLLTAIIFTVIAAESLVGATKTYPKYIKYIIIFSVICFISLTALIFMPTNEYLETLINKG